MNKILVVLAFMFALVPQAWTEQSKKDAIIKRLLAEKPVRIVSVAPLGRLAAREEFVVVYKNIDGTAMAMRVSDGARSVDNNYDIDYGTIKLWGYRLQLDADGALHVDRADGTVFGWVLPEPFVAAENGPLAIYGLSLSGNMALQPEGQGSALPGAGARIGYFGGGDELFGSKDVASLLVRAQAQGYGGTVSRDNTTLGTQLGAASAKLGVGVLEKSKTYYMLTANADWDGRWQDGVPHEAVVGVFGGELGKQLVWKRGKDVVYAGVSSGFGVVSGEDGRNPDGSAHQLASTSFALGASVQGRLGWRLQPGTVQFQGSGTLLQGQGGRGDASVDVNVSRRIQVGGEIRTMSLAQPGREPLQATTPLVRLSLVGF